jgi:tetratricopeptide (TPR) repeat protein
LQEQVVADCPDNPQALHQLALLHAWQQDYQAAVPIYQRLLELEAGNQALRLEAAKNAQAARQTDQALAHYLRLYAQTGGQKEYALILARLWSEKGNHAEAAAFLAPLMDQQPSLEERRRYALELLLAQNFSQSLQAYQQAWEAGDSHKETIVNLARLYCQKKHFRQAATFWDEAGRRQLLDPELRREAALTYSYARRYRDAVAVLQPVDRQDPKLLLFLGQMHFYQEQWDRAAHYYQKYLDHFPNDAEVRQQLAQVLSFEPDRLEEAAAQYDETANISGDPQLQVQKAGVLCNWPRTPATTRPVAIRPRPGGPQPPPLCSRFRPRACARNSSWNKAACSYGWEIWSQPWTGWINIWPRPLRTERPNWTKPAP